MTFKPGTRVHDTTGNRYGTTVTAEYVTGITVITVVDVRWDHGDLSTIPVSRLAAAPYVADPDNPADAEISAAIQRGLANGSLIDADEWMARHAAELGRENQTARNG